MTLFGVRPQFGSPASKRIEEAGRRFQEQRVREKRARVAAEVEAWNEWNEQAKTEKERRRRRQAQERLDRAMQFIRTAGRKITMAEIVEQTAIKHDVSVADIMSARKAYEIAAARQEAMYRCRHETANGSSDIGRYFKKDHTTVIHACQRHAERMATEAA